MTSFIDNGAGANREKRAGEGYSNSLPPKYMCFPTYSWPQFCPMNTNIYK